MQETIEHTGERSDRHGDTCEQRKVAKSDLVVIHEGIIYRDCNSCSQAERKEHSSYGNRPCSLEEPAHSADIGFKTNNKQVEHQSNRRRQIEVRQRLRGEDVLRKPRYPTERLEKL